MDKPLNGLVTRPSGRVCSSGARHLFLALAAFLIALLAGPWALAQPSGVRRNEGAGRGQAAQAAGLSQPAGAAEIQAELLTFADRFALGTMQAAIDLEDRIENPRHRLDLQAMQTMGVSSAYTIATGPNPQVALLDMVVMVTLQRDVLERFAVPEVGAGPLENLLATYGRLEEEIWDLSAKILTPEQQEELREFIRGWRKENPDQKGVSYFRFSEFSKERQASILEDIPPPRGMLKKVGEATRAIEEMRLVTERIFYFLQRLPLILTRQLDLTIMQAIQIPEVQKLFDDLDRLASGVPRLAGEVESLSMTLEALPEEALGKAEAMLGGLGSHEKPLRGLLADVRLTVESGQTLAAETRRLAETLDSLAARMEGPRGAAQEPFRIADYRETAAHLTRTTENLTAMVQSLDRLLASSALDGHLQRLEGITEQVEAGGGRLIDRAFLRSVTLILIALVGLLVVLLIYRFLAVRITGPRKG